MVTATAIDKSEAVVAAMFDGDGVIWPKPVLQGVVEKGISEWARGRWQALTQSSKVPGPQPPPRLRLSAIDISRTFGHLLVFKFKGQSSKQADTAQEIAARLIKGQDAVFLTKIAERTVAKILASIFPETQSLIDNHLRQGHLVFLVSSSPVEVIRPLAIALGLTGHAATMSEVVDGRYSGVITHYNSKEGKAVAVRALALEHNIDLDRSFAYTDGHNDVPMLDLVGHAVVINGDKKLLALAEEKGWETRTYTLTRQPRSSRLRRSAVVAATVAAAAYAVKQNGKHTHGLAPMSADPVANQASLAL